MRKGKSSSLDSPLSVQIYFEYLTVFNAVKYWAIAESTT
ncbi:hypothetical protein D1BOALGB6SA_1417 [Olavius sp. associated proteobacterium Delta 1]|nr:hypothetical protein D1BOALGB6SA_1417 [Olavius sp. associated proteobacterium Delta 1]